MTTDIDGDTRSLTAPSMGADELVADLAITKTDGVTTATPGGSTTYTITASNAGPGGTTGTVADTFPAVLTCTWTCVGAGGGICTASGSGNISSPVTLPAGGSVTYTASCTISVSASGTLANTATVSGVAGDPVPANNSATDSDTLVASADLSITKTDGVTTATPGGSVTYTITAANSAGPSNTTATVADTFPASLTCNWTCLGALGGTCTGAGSGNINDGVTLPVGGSVIYTAMCAISPAATGSLSNTATVTGAATDSNGGNNTVTDTDTLTPSADVSITKTDGVTTATPGGSVTYTITASNGPGPSNTTATVADTFPASLTCTWTCVGAGGGTCTAAGAGNINDPASLPAGGSVTYTASCTISASATGSLSNTATVTGAASDTNPGNNSATDTDTLVGSADIAIAKTVNNASPGIATNVIFTVTATNNGPSDATGVNVTDLLPAGLAHVSNVPSQGSYNPATGLWTVGSLANGATATLTITATVNSLQALVNQASKTAGNEVDTRGSNNTATVRLNGALPLIDIQVSETVDDDTPAISQDVFFQVTAKNLGPFTASGVTLLSSLPAGVSFVASTPSQGTYTSGSGTWAVGSLVPGASATLTLQMTNTVGTPVIQTFTKSFANEQDLVTGNDAASVTLNPATPQVDLAITKIAMQEPVASSATFNYVLIATNLGPGTATGVSVVDSLPAGVTLVSATPSQGPACTGSTTVTCNVGTLFAGGSATVHLVVTKTVGGAVSNTATVSGTESDPNAANNSNTTATTPVTLMGFEVE